MNKTVQRDKGSRKFGHSFFITVVITITRVQIKRKRIQLDDIVDGRVGLRIHMHNRLWRKWVVVQQTINAKIHLDGWSVVEGDSGVVEIVESSDRIVTNFFDSRHTRHASDSEISEQIERRHFHEKEKEDNEKTGDRILNSETDMKSDIANDIHANED